jgi:GT2 family glycosyltransferase
VVLNWQDETATARCVDSLRGLDGIQDCEVIVVDNESSDSSRRALAGLADVRLLPLERNLGFAGGMNAGITAARGEYVALLNNDLVVDAAWLQEGLRVLQDANVGIVGGASLDWDGLAKPDRSSEARAITVVDPDRGSTVLGAAPPTEREVAGVDGSNLLVRADLVLRLQGFDPGYFAYYEDIDLCARAWALGYASVFSPDMRVWHRRGGSSYRIPRQRAFWAARNHIVTVAKHFPDGIWKRTVTRLVVDDILAAVLGHRGGIRTRGVVALDRSQRFGLAQAAWWCATHARYLAARRAATIRLGQHDEGYTDRLRKLAGV